MPIEILTTTHLGALGDVLRDVPRPAVERWDVLLWGDGAGSGWSLPVGWGCTLVDRETRGRRRFGGGMSCGTINIAELMPYVQAMLWYSQRVRRGAREPGRVRRVAICSDHEAVVTDGQALARGVKGIDATANPALWAALKCFERQGFVFSYHWVPRASTALNCFADEVATRHFAAMKAIAPVVARDGLEVSPFDCNPDDGGPTRLDELPRKEPRPRRREGRRRRPCPGDEAA